MTSPASVGPSKKASASPGRARSPPSRPAAPGPRPPRIDPRPPPPQAGARAPVAVGVPGGVVVVNAVGPDLLGVAPRREGAGQKRPAIHDAQGGRRDAGSATAGNSIRAD